LRRNSQVKVVAVPSQAKPSIAESGLFGVAVDWLSLVKFVGILGQLALLLIVLRQFQIESNAFLRLCALTFVGFAIHYFLPMRFRLLF
jgi:hypothetical protein